MSTEKLCANCKVVKSLDLFYKNACKRDGRQSECKVCQGARRTTWGRTHPREKWADNSFYDHKIRGKEVVATLKEITSLAYSTSHCPLCGIELNYGPKGTGSVDASSPSLDRVDTTSPMTLANCMIICHACNAGKGPGSLEEYIERCKRITSKYYKLEMI